jgi:hypothetical protein
LIDHKNAQERAPVERSQIAAESPGTPTADMPRAAQQIEFARVRRGKEAQRGLHRLAVIQGDIGANEGPILKQREASSALVKHVKIPLRLSSRQTTGLSVFAEDTDIGRVEDILALPRGVHRL